MHLRGSSGVAGAMQTRSQGRQLTGIAAMMQTSGRDKGIIPVSEENAPREIHGCAKTSFQSAKSGAGEQLLLPKRSAVFTNTGNDIELTVSNVGDLLR